MSSSANAWISANFGLYSGIIVISVGVVVTIIVLVALFAFPSSSDDSPVPPTPPGPPDPPGPPVAHTRGCANTSPLRWLAGRYTDETTLQATCNLSANSSSGTGSYTVISQLSGSDIYIDVISGRNNLYWNYGDYTVLNSDYYCKNDPTNTNVDYNATSTLGGLLSEHSDTGEMILTSKRVEGFANRQSVRLQSVQSFVYGVFVFKVTGIPSNTSSSTWPAIWLTSPYNCTEASANGDAVNAFGKWPFTGEIGYSRVCMQYQ